MFGWLKTIFVNERIASLERENASLHQDNAWLRAQLEQTGKERNLWEKRFLTEVSSNRKREDVQADTIRNLQGVPGRLPERISDEHFSNEIPKDDNLPEQLKLTFEEEQEIENIARQMCEQALERGVEYDFNIVKQTIRERKDEYLM